MNLFPVFSCPLSWVQRLFRMSSNHFFEPSTESPDAVIASKSRAAQDERGNLFFQSFCNKALIRATLRVMPSLFLLISAPSIKAADSYLDNNKKTMAVQVQRAIYNDDFKAADSIGQKLLEVYPSDPLGPFCQAATLLGRMFDQEEAEPRDSLFAWLDMTDSRASQIMDTSNAATSAWMSFFRGHVRSYRALWESKFGSNFRALRLGFGARSEYERGWKFDSSCYDICLGLGLYHYWKSAKGGLLRTLHILKDEMQKGIDELRRAADSSSISSEAAHNSLIWIWLDRKQYDSALVLSRQMAQQFPDGKLFLWPLAETYTRMERFGEAAEVYTKLRLKLEDYTGNYYNLIECDYQLYRCFEKLDDNDRTQMVADRFRTYRDQIPKETNRRQRHKLKLLSRASRQ